jgi:iron complex transport system substrate-binding protein
LVHRILSLIPSTTEIVCALGFESQLVGRSHECDFPTSVSRLPVLTEAKLDPAARSLEIDGRVKEIVQQGLSVYRVDADLLLDLKPTAILTQDHCDVCAASLDDLEVALASWLGERPAILSLSPSTLDAVWDDIRRAGSMLGASARGERVASALSAQVDALANRTRAIPDKPRVACVEWIDPLMAAGNWMPEMVGIAGGENLFGEAGNHSPWFSWSDLRSADPDVIVVLPCGFDLARTRAEMGPLAGQPGFADLRAVRDGRVYLVDGNQYFNRPGPRLAESAALLAEILHPTRFGTAHAGIAWEVF